MATRRKYREPQGYRDGGAVPPVDNIIIAEPAPPSPAAAAPMPSPPADDDALGRALAAQQRAEELQRQPRTVEQHIDSLALSDHKKQFLKQHPSMATDPGEARAMSFRYHQALNAGIPDDTEEMNQAILHGMQREREHAVSTLVKAPPADPRPIDPTPAPAALAPRKSSLPMSAPPSRDVPSYSSGKPASSKKLTLSPEEVQIARSSIIDKPGMPKMSNAEKEWTYLQNKLRYQQMLADGSYSEQRGGNPTFRAGHRDGSG
jgi:hypothetical protein